MQVLLEDRSGITVDTAAIADDIPPVIKMNMKIIVVTVRCCFVMGIRLIGCNVL